MPRTSSSVSTTCWRAGPPFAFLFACGITNKGCPTLRGLRLLRNSENLSHIVIRCFRNHNILWFSTLKFEFRNSLFRPGLSKFRPFGAGFGELGCVVAENSQRLHQNCSVDIGLARRSIYVILCIPLLMPRQVTSLPLSLPASP